MIDVEKLLELEAKCPPYRLVYEHQIAGLVIGLDEIDLSRRDAELIAAMRNSIRELCLEVKALRALEDEARELVNHNGGFIKRLAEVLKDLDEVRRG
jgi:molybdopterin converting factor small subunit